MVVMVVVSMVLVVLVLVVVVMVVVRSFVLVSLSREAFLPPLGILVKNFITILIVIKADMPVLLKNNLLLRKFYINFDPSPADDDLLIYFFFFRLAIKLPYGQLID